MLIDCLERLIIKVKWIALDRKYQDLDINNKNIHQGHVIIILKKKKLRKNMMLLKE